MLIMELFSAAYADQHLTGKNQNQDVYELFQVTLLTSVTYHPRQDFIFTMIIYLVWGISENLLCKASLASNRKSSFPDQSINNQKIPY